MPQSMTEARVDWVKSTVRQMEIAGLDLTEVLTAGFDKYVKGELTFRELCAIIRDDGE